MSGPTPRSTRRYKLPNSLHSQEHTIVDLGEDEFTVGRLHPMLDNDLRIKRILQEAADPEVAVLLVDVVLGYGAHPDPAAELAPALAEARRLAQTPGRHLEIVAVVVGTDADPQNLEQQVAAAGSRRRLRRPPPMKTPSPTPARWSAGSTGSAACRPSTWRRSAHPSPPSTPAWNPSPRALPPKAPRSCT